MTFRIFADIVKENIAKFESNTSWVWHIQISHLVKRTKNVTERKIWQKMLHFYSGFHSYLSLFLVFFLSCFFYDFYLHFFLSLSLSNKITNIHKKTYSHTHYFRFFLSYPTAILALITYSNGFSYQHSQFSEHNSFSE